MNKQINQQINKKQIKNRLISQLAVILIKKRIADEKKIEFEKLKTLSFKNTIQIKLF